MTARHFVLGTALLFLAAMVLHARRIDYQPPENLLINAKLVCNGLVLSVTPTSLAPDTQDGQPPPEPEMVMEAKIKILHVFKGDAPAEITLRYNVPAANIGSFGRSRFHHLSLHSQERYRFFLLPTRRPGVYYTEMWCSSDECYAAQKLWPDEKDDSAFLTREQAIKLAIDYLHQKRPQEEVDVARSWAQVDGMAGGVGTSGQPSPFGAEYQVHLFTPKAKAGYGSDFIVRDDGTVDADATKWDVMN